MTLYHKPSRRTPATIPLAQAWIDQIRTDLLILDDTTGQPLGRLALTYGEDVATGYPLGYHASLDTPDSAAVIACLRHMMLPKEAACQAYGTQHTWLASGIPARVVLTPGKDMIGSGLTQAIAELGIVLEYGPLPPVTLAVMTGRFLDGQIRAGRLPTGIRASDVDALLTRYLVDVYAQTSNSRVGGIPATLWEQHLAVEFVRRMLADTGMPTSPPTYPPDTVADRPDSVPNANEDGTHEGPMS